MSDSNKTTERELVLITKSASYSALVTMVGYGVLLGSGVVIARLVGPAVIGTVSVAITIVGALGLISVLGMDRGVLKFVSRSLVHSERTIIQKTILYSTTVSLLISLIIIFSYYGLFRKELLGLFNNIDNIDLALDVLIIALPFYVLEVLFASAMSGLQKPHYYLAVKKIAMPITRVLMLLVLLLYMPKIGSLTFATFTIYIAGAALMIYYFMRNNLPARETKTPAESSFGIREFASFSFPLFLIPAFDYGVKEIDILVAGYYLSSEETGIYTVLKRVGIIAHIPLIMFSAVVAATASKLYKIGDSKAIVNIYRYSTKWITLLSVIIYVILWVEAEDLLNIFGEEFKSGAIPLRIYITGQLINAAVGPSGNILLMLGKSNLLIINNALGFIISVLLMLYLTPLYGMSGIAIGFALATLLVNVISVAQLITLLKIYPGNISEYIYRVIVLLISITFVYFVSENMQGYMYLSRILVVSAITPVLVLGSAYIIEGFNDSDRMIYDMVRNRKQVQR